MIITPSSGLPDETERLFLPFTLLHGATAAAILIALYFISLQNIILFHGIVELAGIAVAFSIFIIIWNTRRVIPDAFFLIVGMYHICLIPFSWEIIQIPDASGASPNRMAPRLRQCCITCFYKNRTFYYT